jgi:amino acid permease
MSESANEPVDISAFSDEANMPEDTPLKLDQGIRLEKDYGDTADMIATGYGSIENPSSSAENKSYIDFPFFGVPENSVKNEQETNSGKSAPIHALFNLWKVFIGIGILTGPYAMSHWGMVLGVLGISFAGLLSLYSINIQAQTRQKLQDDINARYEIDMSSRGQNSDRNSNDGDDDQIEIDSISSNQVYIPRTTINNFSDLGSAVYGKKGGIFVSVCLFLQQMCWITAYFSFIQNYIPIAAALSIIIPFCLFWNIKKISYLSLFSLVAIISALTLVFYHSAEHMTVVSKANLKFVDVMNFPYFFGVSIFIFEGNWASLQIETSMKEPRKFKLISTICILFVITLNCVLSCLAYSSYVDTIKDVVLFNLPPNIVSTIVRISYSFGLIFSIPIQISPMVDIIYRSTLLDNYIPLFKSKPVSKYYVGVLLVLTVCVLAAIFIPCLQMFINFSGALIGVLTLSIIPTWFYNKVFKDEITWTKWTIHLVMMVVMIAAGWISMFYSYLYLVHGES